MEECDVPNTGICWTGVYLPSAGGNKMKRYRIEFCLIGGYPAGSVRVVVVRQALNREQAIDQAEDELIGKGQDPRLVSAWEVK